MMAVDKSGIRNISLLSGKCEVSKSCFVPDFEIYE